MRLSAPENSFSHSNERDVAMEMEVELTEDDVTRALDPSFMK